MAVAKRNAFMDPKTLHRDELGYELMIRGIRYNAGMSMVELIDLCNRHGTVTVVEDVVASLIPEEELDILKPKVLELETLLTEVRSQGVIIDGPFRLISLFVHVVYRFRRFMFRVRGAAYDTTVLYAQRANNLQPFLAELCPLMNFPALHIPESVEVVLGRLQQVHVQDPPKKQRSTRDSSSDSDSGRRDRSHRSSYRQSAPTAINPVSRWTLRFNRGDDLEKFLEDVTELAEMHKVLDSDLLPGLSSLLTGDALTWYRSSREDIHTWEDCKQQMREAFAPADNDESITAKIDSLKQKVDETYIVFESRMVQLFNRLTEPYSESQKVKKILAGLHLYYRSKINSGSVKSVRDIRLLCKGFEADKPHILKLQQEEKRSEEKEKKKEAERKSAKVFSVEVPTKGDSDVEVAAVSQPVRPSSSSSNSSKLSAVKCWRCGKYGHLSADCKAAIFCSTCGLQDTNAERCQNCAFARQHGLWGSTQQPAVVQPSLIPPSVSMPQMQFPLNFGGDWSRGLPVPWCLPPLFPFPPPMATSTPQQPTAQPQPSGSNNPKTHNNPKGQQNPK